MRYVWFVTFWGWASESHRVGLLRQPPLEQPAPAWDEWFQAEAEPGVREDIRALEGDVEAQEDFLRWLADVWLPQAVATPNPTVLPCLLGLLARVPPFDTWATLAAHRAGAGWSGPAAVMVGHGSDGESVDVRPVYAALLPLRPPSPQPVLADEVRVEAADLRAPRQAVLALLTGSDRWRLLAHALLGGPEPLSGPWARVRAAGWLGVGITLLYLLFGDDPGPALPALAGGVLAVWLLLIVLALVPAVREARAFLRVAAAWAARLQAEQLRLRIPGGLTVVGGSAGLPIALHILKALGAAGATASRTWNAVVTSPLLLGSHAAATGTIGKDGALLAVALAPKERACASHPSIRVLLRPRNRGPGVAAPASVSTATGPQAVRSVGLSSLRAAVAHLGGFSRLSRLLPVTATLVVSAWMAAAAPDLIHILVPPAAPPVIAPSSPYAPTLWVSLDTTYPRFFQVVLESSLWVNRIRNVETPPNRTSPPRAEIELQRQAQKVTRDFEDGVVWIERRPVLLWRTFAPRERVGRYPLSYLQSLPHD